MSDPKRFEDHLSPPAAAILRDLMDDPELTQDPTLAPDAAPMLELFEHSNDIFATFTDGHIGDMDTWTSSPEVSDVPHPVAPLRHD